VVLWKKHLKQAFFVRILTMKKSLHLALGIAAVYGIVFMAGCQQELILPAKSAPTAEKVSPAPVPAPAPSPSQSAEQPPAKPADKNAPSLKLEKSEHDFGVVGPDTSNKCQFKFSNAGKSVLKIESVQSTCGCTVPELIKKEYAPGESGAIDVTFHSANAGGIITKHLYVTSNDPVVPRAELAIKATVEIKVVVDPNRVELAINKENGGMASLKVKSLDNVPFAITSFSSTGESITCKFDPAAKKTEHILKPTVNISKIQEVNAGIIQIGVDHPQTKEVVVGFSALAMFELRPARIILQNTEPGLVTKREVWIVNNYEKSFEIESITSRNGYMKVVSQKKDGLNIGLDIEITPPKQQEPLRRYITDELNIKIKGGPTLTVRCSGWFKLK
jgi:hypothetical protein